MIFGNNYMYKFLDKSIFKMGVLFLIQSVSCESYKKQHLGVIDNTPGVSSLKDSIKLIYFDTPGSSFIQKKNYQKLIILDAKCVIFDTLFRLCSSGIKTHPF